MLLILFLIVLLGYIQNVIVQTTDVEEGTPSEDIEQIQYAFMADSKAGEVPEKYFLDVSRNFTVRPTKNWYEIGI